MTAREPWFLAPERAFARGARIHNDIDLCSCEGCVTRRFPHQPTSPQEVNTHA